MCSLIGIQISHGSIRFNLYVFDKKIIIHPTFNMNSQAVSLPKTIKIIIPIIVLAIVALWFFFTPEGVLGKADAVGYAVCHRISIRSFFVESRQMPMCARCTGMYMGTACALIFQAIFSHRRGGMPPYRIITLMTILTALWLIDGVNSYLHLFPQLPSLYEPNNILRLVTGSGIGIVAAMLLYPAFQQTIWSDWLPTPAMSGIKNMVALMMLTLVVDFMVLLNNPVLLFGAAIISSAFVLILLSMVYCMLLAILFKIENRWSRLRDVFLLLAAGFGVAIIQIGLMDWIRFILTGSWQGIPIHL
jgi:uncharacterized membrane protein